jgi:hypothetical protein
MFNFLIALVFISLVASPAIAAVIPARGGKKLGVRARRVHLSVPSASASR